MNEKSIQKLLLITVLLGLGQLLVYVYFTGTLTQMYGSGFTRVLWLDAIPIILLLILGFFALYKRKPMFLLLHLFIGPYYLFKKPGAIDTVIKYWGNFEWWEFNAQFNAWFMVFYFTLAILTFFLWLIQRFYTKK